MNKFYNLFYMLIMLMCSAFFLTSCNNSSEQIENNSVFLSESRFLTENDVEKKNNYLELFDHSKYRNQYIIVKQVNTNPVQERYMVFETDYGEELYLTNYSHPEYMFYGKYSLYYDMYDFTGYDVGDRFIIYYTGDICSNMDMARIGLVTMIPEYQLIGSIAQGAEMGEKYISEKIDVLYNYFSGDKVQSFSCMSIEEAIANYIELENLNMNEFYKKQLNTGGYYYTNGNISFTCIASFSINSSSESIQPTYAVYKFNGIPSVDNIPIGYELFIY